MRSVNSESVSDYLKRKEERQKLREAREYCHRCRKPKITCYCGDLVTIHTSVKIVILMHPLEAKHPVGTGRLTHQCLSNSELILGVDFTHNAQVNALIGDQQYQAMVLFPGSRSQNLSKLSPVEKLALCPAGRVPLVFVLDGTWHLARKILFRSKNLQLLPQVSFTPAAPSQFKVRKQPRAECYSTLEATHELLRLLTPVDEYEQKQEVGRLLNVFHQMVTRQMSFKNVGPSRHRINYLRRKVKNEVSY